MPHVKDDIATCAPNMLGNTNDSNIEVNFGITQVSQLSFLKQTIILDSSMKTSWSVILYDPLERNYNNFIY